MAIAGPCCVLTTPPAVTMATKKPPGATVDVVDCYYVPFDVCSDSEHDMSDLPALLPRRNDDDDDSEHDMSDFPALRPRHNDDDDDSDTDDDLFNMPALIPHCFTFCEDIIDRNSSLDENNEDDIKEDPYKICALLNTLTLHDKDEEDILIDDLDDISIVSEVEMEEETFTSKNSFYNLNQVSNLFLFLT